MASSTICGALLFFFFSLLSPFETFRRPTPSNQRPVVIDMGEYRRIPLQSVTGPESLAFDAAGVGPYTGVSDGRVLRWEGRSRWWTEFATPSPSRNRTECDGMTVPEVEDTCGRPLGLQFHRSTGKLYIADAYFGLLAVGPGGGEAAQLSAGADGLPFKFTNGVDVDQETETVYFTDSSARFHRREWQRVIDTGDSTGRFLRYDPKTKNTSVLLTGLQFPNGVAVSGDGDFVLIAETARQRILRYWLRGPKEGRSDVFAQLLWSPDNVKMNSEGAFWVAVASPARLVIGVKLDGNGSITEVLRRRTGGDLVSEVTQYDGKLWLGSVVSPFVGVYDL